MIQLTNAVVPFNDDPVIITNVSMIVSVTVDHTLMNGDCTRIVLNDGEVFQVSESVETVQALINGAMV